MAEAVKDVTITEEVLAVVSEVIEILVVENAEILVAEVSGQEKRADSEAKEARLQEKAVSEAKEAQVQTDQEEKVVSIAIVLQRKHQVLFKEKKEHQDVLKVQVINQQVVHLKLLKAEDQEKAKA